MVGTQQWHMLSPADVLTELQTDGGKGLSQEDAEKRLQEHGPNELKKTGGITWFGMLLAQFQNVLIIILLVAVALSAILGEGLDAIAIAVIVLFAVLLGFIQEYRAERAMEALQKMAAPTATVFRDGVEREVAARDLVPGDIVLLATGDKIPADGRLLEAVNLRVAEASLTGESTPVHKVRDPLPDEALGIGDRKNMVYMGTNATYGRGRAVVIATGMQTEFGKIATMLQSVQEQRTPLQKNLDHVGGLLARGALVIVAMIVGAGFLRGQPFLEILIFGVALAVAVVPEALPAVVTISLAIGVQRMVKRHALIRRLPAVETLGSTSVICSDKTGTLTRDEMTVRKIVVDGATIDVTGAGYEPKGEFVVDGKEHVTLSPSKCDSLRDLLTAATLCNDAHLVQEEEQWKIRGDPTEGGLVVAAAKAGIRKEEIDKQYPRVDEVPFSSETKRMTTVHEVDGKRIAYAKGAPEVILDACRIGAEEKAEYLERAKSMASQALRVLGVAKKEVGATNTPLPLRKGGGGLLAAAGEGGEDSEHGMTFLGLVGMIDPPRTEAKEAVAKCGNAGIRVIMVTGDHPLTAEAIARELGILSPGGRVLTGKEIDAMDEERFRREVPSIQVYARVSPEHKLRLITALQEQGQHVVAMTGDGVNDAPALKKADIGVAMGITGTDVTKEAADMTLTDDNFASIVAAVEEGRGIFGNIKKYLMYLLSANLGEIGIVAGSTLFGLPLPLTALQLLFINLVTDGLPAIALSVDPPEKDLMLQRPRDQRRSIFTRPVVSLMVLGGTWSTILHIGLFTVLLRRGVDLPRAMTMVFVTLIFLELFKSYIFRSDHRPVWEGMFRNIWLNLSVLVGIVPLVAVVAIPALRDIFKTVPLSIGEWGILALLAATVFPVVEGGKVLVRRGIFGHL